MKIAFVLNDLRLSGGVNVILQHASRMASTSSDEVFLLIRESIDDHWYESLVGEANIVPRADWQTDSYDIAIATYWETLLLLGDVTSKSYVWFCQLYEDRFFPDRNPSISTMQIAGSIPLPVVTEAHWLQDLLVSENPDRAVEVVLNGIDKDTFTESRPPHNPGQGFTVLVEGSLDAIAKNTAYALEGSLRSDKATGVTHVGNRPYETEDPRYHFIQSGLSFSEMADLYRSHHVQVKTPVAEGMFGPPLEGFHCGLPAIVTPVTGAEEYIVHPEPPDAFAYIRSGGMLPHQGILHNVGALRGVGGFDGALRIVGDYEALLKLLTVGAARRCEEVTTAMAVGGISSNWATTGQAAREKFRILRRERGLAFALRLYCTRRTAQVAGRAIEQATLALLGRTRGTLWLIRLRRRLGRPPKLL
jgi:hypothetical protein